MKKVMLIGLLFVANIAGAACVGPYCYDDTGASIQGSVSTTGADIHLAGDRLLSRTIAQMNLTTPGAAGEMIYISNSANTAICISSGTGVGAYVSASSPTVHCNSL